MRRFLSLSVLAACLSAIIGCGGPKPTPDEVRASYEALKSGIDRDAVGESVEKLEAFRESCARYEIASTVSRDIQELRAAVPGNLRKARDLAREGEFARAERILRDLAGFFPATEEGRGAGEFLRFEFPMLKATRFMMNRELDGAEESARGLLGGELKVEEAAQVERLLDGISNARLAMSLADAARVENACRMLQLFLKQHYAEYGKYPESLSLETIGSADRSVRDRITESISAIEGYETSEELFSFVAVGKDGKLRMRATQSGVEREEASGKP